MRTNAKIVREVEHLLKDYQAEVTAKKRQGIIMERTAKTYLDHAGHFVRWIRGEFSPGERNEMRRGIR